MRRVAVALLVIVSLGMLGCTGKTVPPATPASRNVPSAITVAEAKAFGTEYVDSSRGILQGGNVSPEETKANWEHMLGMLDTKSITDGLMRRLGVLIETKEPSLTKTDEAMTLIKAWQDWSKGKTNNDINAALMNPSGSTTISRPLQIALASSGGPVLDLRQIDDPSFSGRDIRAKVLPTGNRVELTIVDGQSTYHTVFGFTRVGKVWKLTEISPDTVHLLAMYRL